MALLAPALAQPARADFVIDSFDKGQYDTLAPVPTGQYTTSTGASGLDAFGGSRIITLSRTTGNGGPVSSDSNYTAPGYFTLATPVNTGAVVSLIYDGSSTPTATGAGIIAPTINPGILAPIDLTQGGVNKGMNIQAATDEGAKVVVDFYSANGAYATTTFTLLATGNTTSFTNYFVAFTAFTEVGNFLGFNNVTATSIVMDVSAPQYYGSDVAVNFVETSPQAIPDPSSLTLLVVGGCCVLGVSSYRRRRQQAAELIAA